MYPIFSPYTIGLTCLIILKKNIDSFRQIKKRQYVLQSMASPQLWGEALAQVMGYQEGEFIKAYEELDAIQQDLKLDYNPLVVEYRRLYYDWSQLVCKRT